MNLETNGDIASFITYPVDFLKSFAAEIYDCCAINILDNMNVQQLRQLKGLLKLDNFALSLAAEYGVHPITGLLWHVKFDGIDAEEYHALISRNFEMIEKINKILYELEEE